MSKSITEKFEEIMAKGPDVLPTDIKVKSTQIFFNGETGKHMVFISRGRSNKLGEVNDDAREALTLDYL